MAGTNSVYHLNACTIFLLKVYCKHWKHWNQALDAELKDGTRLELHLKSTKEEKEAISDEEEELFWKLNLLVTLSAY